MKKKVVGVLLMVAVAGTMLAGCGNSAVQAVSGNNWVSKVNVVEFDTEFVEVATAQITEYLESLEVTEDEEEVIEEIEEIIEEVDEVKETVKPESAAEKPVETTAPTQEAEAPVEASTEDDRFLAEMAGYEVKENETVVSADEIAADYDMLPLVNADRTANGVGELTWSSELEQYCKDRIPTIVYNDANNLWIHTGGTHAENIVRGAYSSSMANSDWIYSTEHHDNRLNASYTQYAAVCYFYYDASGEVHTFWLEAFK